MNKIINQDLISLDLKAVNKDQVIKKLAQLINQNGNLSSYQDYLTAVFEREEKTSTGVGREIAIPHGKSAGVVEAAVAFARLAEPIGWESFDNEAVRLVFLLAVPAESESNQHLKILSTLSRNLLNEDFKNELLQAESAAIANEIIQTIFV
ncbi:PTS sugar transporter subunit IIA [Halanaerobium salsuginis]|jgi:fructose-specific phosphotransferase system IIA component|uniref:PTS system, fructose-specific IIA component n=1 Tax=Halanaerobium salsuginis TaxID=29563 RepID=A0A1I4HFZ6_9FIRM|nr:fructose PTS transporter subunit IIA [Halanaerobium salsuginis]SFL41228.1 PTS system, fructose-specific IIA component [Halanaerobium salsuginis]